MNLQFLLRIHVAMDLWTNKGKLKTDFTTNVSSFKS